MCRVGLGVKSCRLREESEGGGGVALTEPHTHSRICRHSQHYLVWRAAPAHNISSFAQITPSPTFFLNLEPP